MNEKKNTEEKAREAKKTSANHIRKINEIKTQNKKQKRMKQNSIIFHIWNCNKTFKFTYIQQKIT